LGVRHSAASRKALRIGDLKGASMLEERRAFEARGRSLERRLMACGGGLGGGAAAQRRAALGVQASWRWVKGRRGK
jgi:hypothetical protein